MTGKNYRTKQKTSIAIFTALFIFLSSCDQQAAGSTTDGGTAAATTTYTTISVSVNGKNVLYGGTVNFGDLIIGASARVLISP